MPTLQQKEALASSALESTQATLDGVLINQVVPNEKDKNLNEVNNYYIATVKGYDYLRRHDFTDEFFFKCMQALCKEMLESHHLLVLTARNKIISVVMMLAMLLLLFRQSQAVFQNL